MNTESATARKIRLRHLRCFVTVARLRSFVHASDALGLTQPAVSRSVRELEKILGHQLFDRTMRGAQLTDRGRLFLASAETGLLHIARGTDAVSGGDGSMQVVRIGALPNVCSQFLPNIVVRFKAIEPDVRFQITPGTNAELLQGLRRGESDFVVGRLSSSEDMKGLSFEALYDEPLIFAVRSGHPLASGGATLDGVLDYPMIMPPEGTIIRQEASRFLASRAVGTITNLIETTSSDFQRTYLETSDAVAIIPRGVLQRDLEHGTVVQLDITGDELKGPVGLTTNPELHLNKAVQLLLSQIRSYP